MAHCKSCTAEITWARTRNNAMMPLDRTPIGRVVITEEYFPDGAPLAEIVTAYRSHFETRISEGYSLRFDALPPAEITITGKGGKDRVVPLSLTARKAMVHMHGRLPYTKGWLQRACRKYGAFNPHRLRHTAACEWIAAGADIGQVQILLGHESPKTTTVYAAYSPERLRQAITMREAMVAS